MSPSQRSSDIYCHYIYVHTVQIFSFLLYKILEDDGQWRKPQDTRSEWDTRWLMQQPQVRVNWNVTASWTGSKQSQRVSRLALWMTTGSLQTQFLILFSDISYFFGKYKHKHHISHRSQTFKTHLTYMNLLLTTEAKRTEGLYQTWCWKNWALRGHLQTPTQ